MWRVRGPCGGWCMRGYLDQALELLLLLVAVVFCSLALMTAVEAPTHCAIAIVGAGLGCTAL